MTDAVNMNVIIILMMIKVRVRHIIYRMYCRYHTSESKPRQIASPVFGQIRIGRWFGTLSFDACLTYVSRESHSSRRHLFRFCFSTSEHMSSWGCGWYYSKT